MATVNLDTAARLDIVCRKGDSFSLTVEFDANMPNPADAGVTYTMVVRKQIPLLELTRMALPLQGMEMTARRLRLLIQQLT